MKGFSPHAITSPANALQNYFLETFRDGKHVLFPVESINFVFFQTFYQCQTNMPNTSNYPQIVCTRFVDSWQISTELPVINTYLNFRWASTRTCYQTRGLRKRKNMSICNTGLSCLDSNTLLKTQFRSNFIISMRGLGFT